MFYYTFPASHVSTRSNSKKRVPNASVTVFGTRNVFRFSSKKIVLKNVYKEIKKYLTKPLNLASVPEGILPRYELRV